MKINFLLVAAALTVLAVSCNNKNASSETTETVDTTTAVCDSTAAAPVSDTTAAAPAAEANASVPDIEAPAEPVADPKIDEDLDELEGAIADMNTMINDGEDGSAHFVRVYEGSYDFCKKLKSKMSKMTSEQKERFKKLESRWKKLN